MGLQGHFEFGFVSKVHGLKGDVTIQVTQPANKPIQKLEMFFVFMKGELIPYFISSVSVLGNQAIVKFDEIDTPAKAQAIKGAKLFLPDKFKPKASKNDLTVTTFRDYQIFDQTHGDLGKVVETYDIANNPLLEINFNGADVLIPFQQNLIIEIDRDQQILKMDLPDGLLDLYTTSGHTKDDGD